MEERLSYNRINQIVFGYLHRFSIDTFVETGTYGGGGICNAMPQAKEIYSIELDEERYLNARRMFERFHNIHIIQGDSGEMLPEIMPKLEGRCLFWLDAHYGSDEVSESEVETPILEELECVLKYPYEFVILIDDARLYIGEGDWPKLDTLKSLILKMRPDCRVEIKNDIIEVIPENVKPIAEDKFVSMSTLGNYGRFGNQLFQYAALKIYSRINGLRAEVPSDWIGRKLFLGCNDVPISKKVRGQTAPTECIWLNGNCFEGYDIKGYCQYHTSLYAPYKRYFRLLYKFIKPLERVLKESLEPLRQGTLIGIHIRLSDYRLPRRRANIAPMQWYLDWLDENWDKLDNPILFLASDEIDNVIKEFRKYNPIAYPAGANLLYDFYTLSHCDYLLISNSTFSFTAAMLNEEGEFYRPDFEQKEMVSFNPWNAKPLLEPV